jgi:hypothetical protein
LAHPASNASLQKWPFKPKWKTSRIYKAKKRLEK